MPRTRINRAKRMPPKTVRQLRAAILGLPADPPVIDPGVWYKTQKEHWRGWLKYYTGGAYGRKPGMNRDTRYAYNHIVEPKMLLWLIPAAGVSPAIVRAAQAAAAKAPNTMMSQSAALRRVVPWEIVEAVLWRPKMSAGVAVQIGLGILALAG